MLRVTMAGLAALMVSGTAFAQDTDEDTMRALTDGVLAGITGEAPADEAEAEAEGEAGLKALITQAISEGQSDAYLEALLSEAAEEGQIEITDGMRTTDGEVDTNALLASIVSKSLAEEAEAETAEAQPEDEPAEDEPAKPRYHVVEEGDSLAAIALEYYRDANDYSRIFEANQDQLTRPDLLNVGQKLLIP